MNGLQEMVMRARAEYLTATADLVRAEARAISVCDRTLIFSAKSLELLEVRYSPEVAGFVGYCRSARDLIFHEIMRAYGLEPEVKP